MRTRITSALLAVAAASSVLTTIGLSGVDAAAAATASTRATVPLVYTTGLAGYDDGGGRWFRFVSTTLTVPARTLPSSSDDMAFITLGHNGGPTPRPFALIEVLPGGGAGSVIYYSSTSYGSLALSPKVGDRLSVSVYYDRHGHDYFTAIDRTRGISSTVHRASSPLINSMPYNHAALSGSIINGKVVPPKVATRLWAFSGSHVTTYRGNKGSILGPWTTSQFIDTTTGTAAGAVVMSAPVLWNGGQNFGVWLRHR